MKTFVENIQDLKDNRDEIIDMIKIESGTNDINIIAKIMKQVVNIVTASNYAELDADIYETIGMAVKDVMSTQGLRVADISEINRINAMNNLPSSMR